jgi:aromatic ring-opening dioxygenase catalytic subunit (LigB family)
VLAGCVRDARACPRAGSGFATHNLRAFFSGGGGDARKMVTEFVPWLTRAVTDASLTPDQRRELLLSYARAPSYRLAHPREEHLLPVLFAAGAARGSGGKMIYDKVVDSISFASYSFDD